MDNPTKKEITLRPTWNTPTTSTPTTSAPPTSTTDDDEEERPTTVGPTSTTTPATTTTGPTTSIAPTTVVVASTATTAASQATLPGAVESTNSCDQAPSEAVAASCVPRPTLPVTGGGTAAGPELVAAVVLAATGAALLRIKRRFVS